MFTGTLDPLSAVQDAKRAPRDRMEPLETPPLVRGVCDYCEGPALPHNRYCGPQCFEADRAFAQIHAKSLWPLLRLWRKHRGKRGTPGAGAHSAMIARLDQILAREREEKTARRIAAELRMNPVLRTHCGARIRIASQRPPSAEHASIIVKAPGSVTIIAPGPEEIAARTINEMARAIVSQLSAAGFSMITGQKSDYGAAAPDIFAAVIVQEWRAS